MTPETSRQHPSSYQHHPRGEVSLALRPSPAPRRRFSGKPLVRQSPAGLTRRRARCRRTASPRDGVTFPALSCPKEINFPQADTARPPAGARCGTGAADHLISPGLAAARRRTPRHPMRERLIVQLSGPREAPDRTSEAVQPCSRPALCESAERYALAWAWSLVADAARPGEVHRVVAALSRHTLLPCMFPVHPGTALSPRGLLTVRPVEERNRAVWARTTVPGRERDDLLGTYSSAAPHSSREPAVRRQGA
jgi:hypothetical protein